MEKHSLERLKEITSVFAAYGFGYMVKSKGKKQSKDPENLRKAFEKLGSTFIKIGQILSTRPDILPEEYIQELSKLQDSAPEINFTFMRQVFFEEINKDIRSCFRDISIKPIATASIAQVYTACLDSGERVVIKIQKPNIEEMIHMDIHILKKMVSLLSIYNNFMLVDPMEALEEIESEINRELDFNIEKDSILKFKRLNEGVKCIYAPDIVNMYCSKRVITMERIDGFKINDLNLIEDYGYDKDDIAKKLAISYCKQVFGDGFFHGDPHPGNILISNGKICFIDFGLVGELTPAMKEQFNNGIMGVATRDVDKLVDFLINISIRKGKYDRKVLYDDVKYLLDVYLASSIKNIVMSVLIKEIMEIAKRNNLQLPKDFMVLFKSAVIMEGVVAEINPDMNILDFVIPFVKSKYKNDILNDFNLDDIAFDAYKIGKSVTDIPVELSSIIKNINRGRFKVNIETTEFKETIREVNKMINRIVFGLVVGAMIIGSSLILSSNIGPRIKGVSVIGVTGYIISAIFGLYLIISIIRSGNLK